MISYLRGPFFVAVAWAVAACAWSPQAWAEPQPPGAADMEFFERKIRPVLVKHCYECHSADSEDVGGGLLLDNRDAMLRGGESGPALVPAKPTQGTLLSAIEFRDFEMPPEGKLPEDVIADFRKWIRLGAPDPRKGPATVETPDEESEPSAELWSLQPIRATQPPAVKLADWPQSDIDRFVLARLEQHHLRPVGDAPPHHLLRRLYFDLVGLPPPPEELARLENDPAPTAWVELVDRLLDSPQFGERWARHWLDVVRYGESAGNSRDVLMPYAWRYRNYVIDAFNSDLPYDRFLVEQLAGDLLARSARPMIPGEQRESEKLQASAAGAEESAAQPSVAALQGEQRDRLLVATGLLAVGSKSLNGGNVALDIVDDQIDVLGKAILGLTVGCARCHDHKFDPIPTADYYALAGIFKSTQTLYGGGTGRPKSVADKAKVYLVLGEHAEDAARQLQTHQQQLSKLEKQRANLARQVQQIQKRLPKDWKQRQSQLATAEQRTPQEEKQWQQIRQLKEAQDKLRQLQAQLAELKRQPLPQLQFAVGVREGKVSDSPIHVRGEAKKLGDVVPRGFLSCAAVEGGPQIEGAAQSGRLELAQWLTHPAHPLTARVIVNRVWQHLFGRGLVETVDNFGTNGIPPTHPELLDYLAHRMIHTHGWSLKALIRELVLTRTYQLASDLERGNYAADPANALYWRMSRRRLEAEALRDAMLAASGQLQLERPEASVVTRLGEGEVGRGIKTSILEEPFPHRSVYLPIIRGLVPEFLKVFDYPEPSNSQGQRATTNVPAQSLYLMNSPFVIEQSGALAKRLLETEKADAHRLQRVYQLCLGRSPSELELEASEQFLAAAADRLAGKGVEEEGQLEQIPWTMFCQALLASAEFRYLD